MRVRTVQVKTIPGESENKARERAKVIDNLVSTFDSLFYKCVLNYCAVM